MEKTKKEWNEKNEEVSRRRKRVKKEKEEELEEEEEKEEEEEEEKDEERNGEEKTIKFRNDEESQPPPQHRRLQQQNPRTGLPPTTQDLKNQLFLAVKKGDLELVKSLITLSARNLLSAKDKQGRTPLHSALLAPNPDLEIVKFLISSGLDVNGVDECECTPLGFAIMEETDIEIVKCLLLFGADATDALAVPLRHFASEKGIEVMKLLISFGADIEFRERLDDDIEDRYGAYETPLHNAATLYDDGLGVIKCLLMYGADTTAQNEEGETPIDLAWLSSENGKMMINHQTTIEHLIFLSAHK
eukprot:TRINITY_DN3578_c0_g4_i2.p1 TRINITY_DN3578_c0_g4~~TRINITY_DN3578_c0_g4_i2.p1  ORF type:complete len:302 (+),score=100.69 TRINITY_DN3578_c0_g4_i2:62-967(+)